MNREESFVIMTVMATVDVWVSTLGSTMEQFQEAEGQVREALVGWDPVGVAVSHVTVGDRTVTRASYRYEDDRCEDDPDVNDGEDYAQRR